MTVHGTFVFEIPKMPKLEMENALLALLAFLTVPLGRRKVCIESNRSLLVQHLLKKCPYLYGGS